MIVALAPLVVVATLLLGRSVWLTFLIYHLGICLVAPAIHSRREGRGLRAHARMVGLRRVGLGLGAGLGVGAAALVVGAFILFGDAWLAGADVRGALAAWGVTPRSLPLLFAVMLLGNGAAEELFWRGWVQAQLGRTRPPRHAIALGAAAYASYHAFTIGLLLRDRAVTALLTAAVFAAGCAWGWLRQRTGSVWPALLSHAGATAGYMAVLWWRVLRAG